MMKILLFAVFELFMLSACGVLQTRPAEKIHSEYFYSSVNLYEDQTTQERDLVHVRLVNPRVSVKAINDINVYPLIDSDKRYRIEGKKGLYEKVTVKFEARLPPGKHKLKVIYVPSVSSYGGSITLWKEAKSTLALDAKAGHYYTVIVKKTGENKFRFSINDHGPDYDNKCGSIFETHFRVMSLSKNIPSECY